ncbi:hypothetical protein NP233_g10122 [Leucocoprinus birnbaumii]|uniref:Elongation of fatty acids protein n=1 Tax=Leucocoprinus birnbaumii TaxID=56174 RepID=A0AAD5VJD6_9AGAR|nr:hypothetical protein NP233_g10122 [Leucocoprinus birnbaumii]
MGPIADFFSVHAPFKFPHYFTSYIVGETPLSTTPVVMSMVAGYLTTIFGIKIFMSTRQPFKLTALFQVHNLFLSLISALLLSLTIEEIVPRIWQYGLHSSLCDHKTWTPRMEFYHIINYYLKYLEFLDTVFLALKKKPLSFLHVYHHSATAVFCFLWLNAKPHSVSWVFMTINLAVHVVMYYYYYAAAAGKPVSWKKHLTAMQIVQFVIDIAVIAFGIYENYAHRYHRHLPHFGNCQIDGGPNTMAGCALLTSYLVLFLKFYAQTYNKGDRVALNNY